MTDIRKRKGAKGVIYQVRYPSKASKSGYAYKTFLTLKEARYFAQHEMPKLHPSRSAEIKSVDQAIFRERQPCVPKTDFRLTDRGQPRLSEPR
jgi:integrase